MLHCDSPEPFWQRVLVFPVQHWFEPRSRLVSDLVRAAAIHWTSSNTELRFPDSSGSYTVYSQTQIDPVVSFRNSQREQVRGTIINLQRKSLVMEVYNPYSIVQVSEVLSELTVRMGSKNAYLGKAVVVSLVNTGLTAVVSLALIDEWRELSVLPNEAKSVGREAELFISDWDARFNIRRDYQIVVNEMRAFLSEV
jgi:extracellular factor (EF) 3-hydroxypalmitic acid methyl ester biosynthesis protein